MNHIAAASGSDPGSIVGTVIFVIVGIAAYWAPTIVAYLRHVHGFGQIVVVNFFLGWTGIGWVIALVMAFRHVEPTPASGQVPSPPNGV